MEESKKKKMPKRDRKKEKEEEKKNVPKESKTSSTKSSGGSSFKCCGIFLAVSAVILAAAAYHVYTTVFQIPEMPEVDLDKWWGPNDTKDSQDTSVRPFKILFTDAMQEQLVKKFEFHRLLTKPKSFQDTAWTYGVHSEGLAKVFALWQYKYPFRERQKYFNQFPHFKTNIQGLDIHFVRVKPEVKNVKVFPIILLHGWPSSFREFYDVIPLLTTKRPGYDFVFEVIVPSLPGFGFSQAAVRPGLGPFQVAIIMRNLMQRLGFTQYYIQGGDFGHVIGSLMATVFPNEVLGFHSNMPMTFSKPAVLGTVLGAIWPTFVEPKFPEKIYPLKEKVEFQMEETGYSHLQATKPDTIGIVLNESPAGLAAYIIEKFMIYTNANNKYLPDGGISNHYNATDLIDNIMVYWVTGSITTSMRIYKELLSGVEYTLEHIPTPVQTWFLNLKNEIFYDPEIFLRWKFPNLKGMTSHNFGGHFAALERPKELADDVFLAVKSFDK